LQPGHQHFERISSACGLVEQRTHHQVAGELMKFLSSADWTGIVETELFAPTTRPTVGDRSLPGPRNRGQCRTIENGRGFLARIAGGQAED